MSCLVVIRVGDSSGTWYSASRVGKWSSPESHVQAVRNAMVEGYTVYGLFVSTGDIPIMTCKINGIRERINDDAYLFPPRNTLGELKTFLLFEPNYTMSYIVKDVLQYVKYKVGSQILIPHELSNRFFNSLKEGNKTTLNPEYLNKYIY
jgi:hypothetical protein